MFFKFSSLDHQDSYQQQASVVRQITRYACASATEAHPQKKKKEGAQYDNLSSIFVSLQVLQFDV